MSILYDVPAGSSATIVGPAELRVRGSSSESRYLLYDTGGAAGAPVIDYVAPATAVLPSVAIDVGGSGFASTAVVVFDGAAVPTNYISETLLRADVSAGAAGSYDVLVRDGAVDSNIVPFAFT
jgi:hypothetical protein